MNAGDAKTDDEQPDKNVSTSRVDARSLAVGFAFLLLALIPIHHPYLPRVLFGIAVLDGIVLWMIPPYTLRRNRVPPLDENPEVLSWKLPHFRKLTRQRFMQLAAFAGTQGAVCGLVAVIVSPFYALMTHRDFVGTVILWMGIGAIASTAGGALFWHIDKYSSMPQ